MTDAIQRLRGLAVGLCHESGIGLQASEDRWAFDPEKRVILVSKTALAELGPEGCAGVLAHEVGHVAISRYHLFAPGPPTPAASSFLANCLEDARVETWMCRRYPGVAGWLDKARDTHRMLEHLPKQPLFVQYAVASRLAWSSTGEPIQQDWKHLAEPVRQALERTELACSSYVLEHLPPLIPGLLEGRTQDVAAYESEVLLVEDELVDTPSLWEKLVRVLAHRSHETLLKQILPEVLPLWSADVERIGSLLDRRPDLRQRVQDETTSARSGLVAEVVRAAGRKTGAEHELSQTSRRCAVRVLNEFLQAEAEDRDAGLARAMEGGSPRRPPATERVARSVRANRRANWLEAWHAVEGQARELVRSLERLLRARRQDALRGSQATGSRVDMRALVAAEADPRRSQRVWTKRTAASRRHETAFLLLVDLSGSMQGKRIQAATRATVLLSEVLGRIRVPFSVMGFQDVLIPVVGFGEFAQPARERIALMAEEVAATREGGNNQPAYNDDGPCLREASETLLQRRERERVLVVISDGLPEGARSNAGDLRRAIGWAEGRGIRLLGLGLGPHTDHVESYYRFGRGEIEVGELASVVGELVGRVLEA
jgi:Mg-chelatase subunit ChlD